MLWGKDHSEVPYASYFYGYAITVNSQASSWGYSPAFVFVVLSSRLQIEGGGNGNVLLWQARAAVSAELGKRRESYAEQQKCRASKLFLKSVV